jgi:hypothetical protein
MVHDIIVPLRASSDDLEYDNHNLWILDDRLAFYTFFLCDKPFRSFSDTASGREADLAVLFDRSLAFRGETNDQPIIIVEFKRPGRNDYDGNTNPVSQVLEYVDIFRSGQHVKDKDGKIIRTVSNATRFICYVVADLTDTLVKVVRTSPANNKFPDGEGYFGFSPDHNAWIEVLPYHKIIHDARIRHEAFFRRLNL